MGPEKPHQIYLRRSWTLRNWCCNRKELRGFGGSRHYILYVRGKWITSVREKISRLYFPKMVTIVSPIPYSLLMMCFWHLSHWDSGSTLFFLDLSRLVIMAAIIRLRYTWFPWSTCFYSPEWLNGMCCEEVMATWRGHVQVSWPTTVEEALIF